MDVHWSNGKAFAWCPDCGKLVQLNKPVLGALHFCTKEEA